MRVSSYPIDRFWKGGGVIVPNELCWISLHEIGFITTDDPPLLPNQVRAQTSLARIRRGADLTPPDCAAPLPRPFQSWGTAEILETGSAVVQFKPGDRVYGPMKIADRQVLDANQIRPLAEFYNRPEFSVFIDAGAAALRAVHDAKIRFGDRVAIWGMGTVGLMAAQYAMLSGAREVIAVDPLETRLQIAQKLGAHRILPSWDENAGALHAAIDCAGAAAARRQIEQIASSGAVHSFAREPSALPCELYERAEFGVVSKRVIVWPIISHVIPFDRTPAACAQIQAHPHEYIQALVSFNNEFKINLRCY